MELPTGTEILAVEESWQYQLLQLPDCWCVGLDHGWILPCSVGPVCRVTLARSGAWGRAGRQACQTAPTDWSHTGSGLQTNPSVGSSTQNWPHATHLTYRARRSRTTSQAFLLLQHQPTLAGLLKYLPFNQSTTSFLINITIKGYQFCFGISMLQILVQ